MYQTVVATPEETSLLVDPGLTTQERYYYTVFAQSSTGLWGSLVVQGENADATYPSAAGTASVFRITKEGNVHADGAYYGQSFEAGSADVAEWVSVSEPVEPGDVLELDPDNPSHYRKARGPCSDLVAGVVSTDPGFVLGSSPATEDSGLSTPNRALLALLGIVPVKVTDEGGPIQPGDLLVTSSTPGYAMRWSGLESCPCALIGKALDPLGGKTGIILVLLTAH